jgi:hypothetical protein
MSRFRWVDLHDQAEGNASPHEDTTPYLGTTLEDDVLRHRWLDGTTLPVIAGGAGDNDDDDDNDDDGDGDDDSDDNADNDDSDDEDDDEPSKGKSLTSKQRANLRRASRQAAKFRIEAKTERARADAAEERERTLLSEIAFARAAGDRFADADAAWKLVDRKLITIDDEGEVSGVDEAIEALIESHPFIVSDDDEKPSKKGDNPFRPSSSGSTMTGKRRPIPAAPSEATLAKKYPALRNR